MRKNKRIMLFIFVIITVLLTVLDQAAKYLAVLHLKDKASVPLIDGVLELQYLENRGAAFGMMQGQKVFILFVGIIFLAVILFCVIKLPDKPRYKPVYFILSVMTAGAIGNMIDRIRLDYVIDFIYFSLIDFPIFNVADIYVTVSVTALAIMILFVYKEEDFDFLKFKQKKFREIK